MMLLIVNAILNEDCFLTMKKITQENLKVDFILTSPPYNTSRIGRKDPYSTRYKGFKDNKTDEEYIKWTIGIFNTFDDILKENGAIAYNISYSSEKTDLIWRVISNIIDNTNFTTADCIVWKKKSAIPNNVSKNKLTRIVEFIFILCRKDELGSFCCNKKVKSINKKTKQNYYENIFNYIEAANNDGSNKLNKSTYSTELCEKILNIYTKENDIVYDPFMGTGTTANACSKLNRKYIGSEISEEQCIFAENRIAN
ncbi:site-specific DNA-methyltransferase [Clostridium perfringens]|nr:site-specific DNA-methyltransferase [Clostridium perfringens]